MTVADTERDRMLRGEPYDSRDPALLALAHRARALVAAYAALPSTDAAGRHAVLASLLGAVAPDVWIEPPFFVDYGAHVEIGAGTFLNTGCVLLDSAAIRIGRDVLLGPGVQLLTATHPLAAAERIRPAAARAAGAAPYLTRAAPITIEDGCWLGAGVLVMPGVTIGARTTVAAGSVVTASLPADVLAVGTPARVVRSLG
jgi:maltose O-acetyltransferase